MSATADFLMELEEATDYLRARLGSLEVKRFDERIIVTNDRNKYEVKPVPREDYKTSRRMKGWMVTGVEPGWGQLAMVRSYEDAAIFIEKDMGIYKGGEDDGLPRAEDDECPYCGADMGEDR